MIEKAVLNFSQWPTLILSGGCKQTYPNLINQNHLRNVNCVIQKRDSWPRQVVATGHYSERRACLLPPQIPGGVFVSGFVKTLVCVCVQVQKGVKLATQPNHLPQGCFVSWAAFNVRRSQWVSLYTNFDNRIMTVASGRAVQVLARPLFADPTFHMHTLNYTVSKMIATSHVISRKVKHTVMRFLVMSDITFFCVPAFSLLVVCSCSMHVCTREESVCIERCVLCQFHWR